MLMVVFQIKCISINIKCINDWKVHGKWVIIKVSINCL